MKKIFLFCFCALSLTLFSQNNSSGWIITGEPAKNFIENKSQFNGKDKLPDSKILFGIDQNGTQIYFAKQGLTYRFDIRQKKDKQEEAKENKKMTAEEWAAHEKEERSIKIETDLVHLQWENANPNVQVVAEEEASGYYSYSTSKKENINYIKGYKKLIYKNLYPNIDVEYVFPGVMLSGVEASGIKYSLILHPGADVSQVKMVYSNVENVSADKKNNIHISTMFGDIIDHAPKTFYAGNANSVIASSFVMLSKNEVSFSLGNYDKTKTVVVDPWTQTPTLANSNCVWECERDGAGNVYIIGGDMPMKLLKYNAAGTYQWTYSTPWDTSNNWLGTLATDLAGNSYITSGSVAAMQKVDVNGGMVWSKNGGSMDEYWTIAFNCDQTKLVVGGTRLGASSNPFGTGGSLVTGNGVIFDINTSNGNVTATKFVTSTRNYSFMSLPISDVEEVRSISSSKNAKYYFLTLDTLGAIDQNLSACPNGNLFSINHTYDWAYKMENYRPNNGNSGICSIKANDKFVYTQNGATLHKRSLATGAILATASIPSGIYNSSSFFGLTTNQSGNSGIDIDTCGNVYVGSKKSIIKYDANLNLLSSVTLPFDVYDVAVSTNGNVIACGAVYDNSGSPNPNNRIGYVQSIASFAACDPLKLQCCDANVCNAGPFCTTDPAITLSPSIPGGTWGGPGVNTSTGVFTPSVAGSGTFTITYSLACGNGTMQIVVKNCAAPVVCLQSNGDITASGGGGPTYTWSSWTTGGSTPITNQAQCTACNASYSWNTFLGQCLNGFTPVTSCTTTAGYQQFATGTTVTPPGTWPLQLSDGQGNTLVINSAAGIQPCGPPSPMTATVTPNSPVCNGLCTGTATANQTGGTAPLTYSWNTSPAQTTQTATGLCMGNYNVLVTDASAHTATATVSITQPVAIASTASVTNTTCGASTGTAQVTASGGTGSLTYNWNPSGQNTPTATGLGVGNYSCTITDANGCTHIQTASIANTNGPTATTSVVNNVLCNGGSNGSATATAAGGTSPYTYSWTNGQTTSSATGLSAGIYTVTVSDASGCSNTQTVSITAPTALTASTTVTLASCGQSDGSASANPSGGSSPYTYLWTPSNQTTQTATGFSAGSYSVIITDANGCSKTFTTTIANSNGPNATINTIPASCGQSDGSATANAAGGTSPYTYLWNPSSQTTQTATGLSVGNYSVIITDANGCSHTATTTITNSNGPTAVAGTSTTIMPGGSAPLTSSGGVSYVWSPATGLSNPNISNPVAQPSTTTNYCVHVTNASGCSDSACVTIYVEAPTSPCEDVFVPTAFSPDIDGKNKLECILGSVNCIQTFDFSIYDRWGQKVFETTDASICWDGVYKGKLMNTAVFVYYLEAIFTDGKKINRKGNISLIR